MASHLCVRVYANGEARHTVRDEEGLRSWLDYNRRHRPGNALFVDGVLPDPAVDRGYLGEAQAEQVSASLLDKLSSMGPLTAWRQEYDHVEKASIYPERGWPRFDWPRAGEEPSVPAPGR